MNSHEFPSYHRTKMFDLTGLPSFQHILFNIVEVNLIPTSLGIKILPNMGVSINRGIPKWLVNHGKSQLQVDDLVVYTPISGTPYTYLYLYIYIHIIVEI